MPRQYAPEAIDHCLKLYLKYNGQQHKKIEQEMRKAGWAGWNANYLYTRGKGRHQKLGWVEKYGWEKALQLHLANKVTGAAALNSAEKLVREIEYVRELLYTEIKAQGGNLEKEKLQLHRDYSNLSIAALTKVEAARDTLGAWVNFWERLQDWVLDIDAKAARYLQKYSEPLIARAKLEFGESEMNVSANSEDTSTDDRAEA